MSLIRKIILDRALDTIDKKRDFFTAKPFNLHLSLPKSNDLQGLWLLKYDQIRTDFCEPFCKEARGIIFDGDEIVCCPFYKFFNANEKHADKIDWSTAVVQHKYDGSIIKVYWLEANESKQRQARWMVATNGTIDARTATVDEQNNITFFDLFEEARKLCGFNYDLLDKNCTYMFELMHPKSLIVVRYTEPRLVHIGTRNNKTLQESYDFIGVQQVETFPLQSLEECLAAASKLGQMQEGYVVVDKSYNRNKIKGEVYLTLHHTLTNNHLSTEEAAASLVLRNEQSEINAYSENPQMVDICKHISAVEKRLELFLEYLAKAFEKIQDQKLESRRDIAAAYRAESEKNFALFMGCVSYKDKNKQDQSLAKEIFRKLIFDKLGSKKIDRATIREFLELIK